MKALYEVLYQRPPRAEEVRLALEFVRAGRVKGRRSWPAPARTANKNRPDGAERRRDRLAANKTPAKPNPGNRDNGRRAIQNEGEMVDRKPLTPWEEYAQALLFTNEIAYVN